MRNPLLYRGVDDGHAADWWHKMTSCPSCGLRAVRVRALRFSFGVANGINRDVGTPSHPTPPPFPTTALATSISRGATPAVCSQAPLPRLPCTSRSPAQTQEQPTRTSTARQCEDVSFHEQE